MHTQNIPGGGRGEAEILDFFHDCLLSLAWLDYVYQNQILPWNTFDYDTNFQHLRTSNKISTITSPSPLFSFLLENKLQENMLVLQVLDWMVQKCLLVVLQHILSLRRYATYYYSFVLFLLICIFGKQILTPVES